jgi:TRAP-type C4-dicarboxylate transport system substrate-binding protein
VSRLTLIALIAAAAAFAGCLGESESDKAGGARDPEAVVLTLANHEDSTGDIAEFAREVARQSGGSVRIEPRNGWRAGQVDYERRTIEDVRAGEVDLAKVSARAFDLAGVKSFQPLVAPFAVDSYALERRVLASPLAGEMLRGVEQIDLVGIALLPGDLRKPVGISRALVGAPDYRGSTIATRESELGAETFRALGATPESVEPGDDLSSFDGAELGISGVEGDELDGPARTLAANVNLWPRVLVIVMNRDAYEALDDEQREALRAAGRAALGPAMERIQSFEKEALGILCNRGEVTLRSAGPGELDDLRTATSSLPSDPAARRAAEEIAAMRAEVEPEPAPRCGNSPSGAAGEGGTPVDGLWRMETTEREYAEIAPPSDVVPENWGEFTFAFADGRFAFTTENGGACLWAYGRYEVKGNLVEWTVEDGGGISVTEENFFNRPGEFFTYRWSRYRDRLTLEPVEGAISAEPYRVNPWRLLDAEPALAGLARRCRPPSGALQP